MKFSAILILILFGILGCSTFGKLTITKDEFKKTTLVNVTLKHETKETLKIGLFARPYPAIFEYYREIDPKKNYSPASVRIKFSGSVDDPNISEKAFLKVGEKNFDIKLTEVSGSVVSGVHTSTSTGTTYGKTASGGVDYSKPNYNSQVTTAHAYNYKSLLATITLTEEQEIAIKNGKDLVYRIYIGNSPYTFAVSEEDDLAIVKNFLGAKGE